MQAGLGFSTGRHADRLMRRGSLLGLGLGLLTVIGVQHASAPLQRADAAYWKPIGPPCRLISRRALLALDLPLDQQFPFQDLSLTRVAGGAYCSGRQERAGLSSTESTVCQMTNPIALSVIAGGREYDFAPGVAQPATIVWKEGALTCVLASNFHYGD
jgi:hypothetical protein